MESKRSIVIKTLKELKSMGLLNEKKILKEASDVTMLFKFRLYDPTYGDSGNKATLAVYLKHDNTLGYSYYGGWQDSGTAYSISNLQLKKSLPSTINSSAENGVLTIKSLEQRITSILATGVGSHVIKTVERLNDLPKNKVAEEKSSSVTYTTALQELSSGNKTTDAQIRKVLSLMARAGYKLSK